MQIRFEHSPAEVKAMDTQQLRDAFLVDGLVNENRFHTVYTHYDRIIISGVTPVNETVELQNFAELRSEYFLERREMGIINVGGNGIVEADGVAHELGKLSALYVSRGTKTVRFLSKDASTPAVYFIMSTLAHAAYPTRLMHKEEAAPVALGAVETANKRTVYKYIHLDGIKSCQLVMGLTVLENGSVWNSVPPHTHTRRTEVYFYFDLPEEQCLFHFMGQPQETRHIVMKNYEAVIAPSWSVHFGSGTSNYGFIWGMAGENQVYSDMDPAPVIELK